MIAVISLCSLHPPCPLLLLYRTTCRHCLHAKIQLGHHDRNAFTLHHQSFVAKHRKHQLGVLHLPHGIAIFVERNNTHKSSSELVRDTNRLYSRFSLILTAPRSHETPLKTSIHTKRFLRAGYTMPPRTLEDDIITGHDPYHEHNEQQDELNNQTTKSVGIHRTTYSGAVLFNLAASTLPAVYSTLLSPRDFVPIEFETRALPLFTSALSLPSPPSPAP